MYIVVPIPRLILDNIILLDDIVLCSMLTLENKKIEIFGNSKCRDVFDINAEYSDYISDSYAIYKTDIDINNITPDSIEKMIYPVDMALDCLRINLTSFKFHEQIIGTPGFINGRKSLLIFNDDWTFNKVVSGKTKFYSMSEGIGCDAQGITVNEKTKDLLLSARNDEVYIKYRRILHRACKSMEIFDIDNCFSFLCSVIESLVSVYGFTKKKKSILSFISTTQEKFDILSQQFYFYSKVLRTQVVHCGKSLLTFYPWKKAYYILNDLFLLIEKFCIAVIESEIYSFDELNAEIEKRIERFVYTIPSDDNILATVPEWNKQKCDYYAEISNLYLEKFLKIGNTIFIPANSKKLINELREIYNYGIEIMYTDESFSGNIIDNEKRTIITPDFPNYNLFHEFNVGEKSFTLWDIDIIFTSLFHLANTNVAIAISEDQLYFSKSDKDFNYYAQFSDLICNTIQKAFSYPILLLKESTANILPSRVGVSKEGIRTSGIMPPRSSSIDFIPGRVYGEYREPEEQYIPKMLNGSDILYKCLYDNRIDEVFVTNQNALHHLADSIYINDLEEKLICIFNAFDMLCPDTTEGDKLIKRIGAFICTTEKERLEFIRNQQGLRNRLRNPIIHGGKMLSELQLGHSEIVSAINELKQVIVKYCENVYIFDITTFSDLAVEQTRRVNNMLK